MIGVALETGVKLEISHFKLMGSTQWGRADELLAKVDLARARGSGSTVTNTPMSSLIRC